jgi:hypothetical protein
LSWRAGHRSRHRRRPGFFVAYRQSCVSSNRESWGHQGAHPNPISAAGVLQKTGVCDIGAIATAALTVGAL